MSLAMPNFKQILIPTFDKQSKINGHTKTWVNMDHVIQIQDGNRKDERPTWRLRFNKESSMEYIETLSPPDDLV